MTEKPRPNILFITADQWRGDCLSSLNHPAVKTPNVDALVRDGVLFSNHFSQTAPCSPARASLLTGLYQMNHRVCRNGTPLDIRFTNIAIEARRGGYDPTLFGYTDQSVDPRFVELDDPRLETYEGILPGFTVDTQLDGAAAPWLDWLKERGVAVPDTLDPLYYPEDWDGTPGPIGPGRTPPRFKDGETETVFLTDCFLSFLDRQGEEPWFAHVSFLRPHPPFSVPEPWNEMVRPEDAPPPMLADTAEDEANQHPFLAFALEQQWKSSFVAGGVEGLAREWNRAEVAELRAIYYGMVAEVDAQIGRIVAELKDRGLWKNTVIVLTSDHGEMLGDHHLFGKLGYFDQAYHVPLIIRDPRRPLGHGRRVEAFTEAVDIMPTLLDAAGLEVPPQCDGRSLLPYLANSWPKAWRRAAFWEYDFREIATGTAQRVLGLPIDQCQMSIIRDSRFKYVHFAALPPLLFHLETDPHEMDNKAGDPAYASILAEYAGMMLSRRMLHADRTLTGIHLGEGGALEVPVIRRLR